MHLSALLAKTMEFVQWEVANVYAYRTQEHPENEGSKLVVKKTGKPGTSVFQKQEASIQLWLPVPQDSIDFCPRRVLLDLQTCQVQLKNFKDGNHFNSKKNTVVQDK